MLHPANSEHLTVQTPTGRLGTLFGELSLIMRLMRREGTNQLARAINPLHRGHDHRVLVGVRHG